MTTGIQVNFGALQVNHLVPKIRGQSLDVFCIIQNGDYIAVSSLRIQVGTISMLQDYSLSKPLDIWMKLSLINHSDILSYDLQFN